ncbi:GNAT family N-acetyltransferase [Yoonia sp.]|nr:GNAT family N-acetyltransferase [Yoonia sp.]
MSVSVSFATEPPERATFHQLLLDYYNVMIPMNPPEIAALISADKNADEFWTEIHEYLPPHGRLALAHDNNGVLLGGGMMRNMRPDAVEFKRLFVRPQGRGLGLGRLLVQARIDAAREMGMKHVFADTLRGTVAMQSLYKAFGFREIDRYPESRTAISLPALQPELRYFQLDL